MAQYLLQEMAGTTKIVRLRMTFREESFFADIVANLNSGSELATIIDNAYAANYDE